MIDARGLMSASNEASLPFGAISYLFKNLLLRFSRLGLSAPVSLTYFSGINWKLEQG
jgi:hypothetical protein